MPKPRSKPKQKSKPKPRSKPKPKQKSKPKPRSKPKPKPRSKPKPKPISKTKPRSKPKPKLKPKPKKKLLYENEPQKNEYVKEQPKIKSKKEKTLEKQNENKQINKPRHNYILFDNVEAQPIEKKSFVDYKFETMKEVTSIDQLDSKTYMTINNCLKNLNTKVLDLENKKFVPLFSNDGSIALKLIKNSWEKEYKSTGKRTFFKIFDSLPKNFQKDVLESGQNDVVREAFLSFFIHYVSPSEACSNVLYNNIKFYYDGLMFFSNLKYYKIDPNLKHNIQICKQRFYLVNIVIFGENGAHQNIIIVDKLKKQITYFEPHGRSYISQTTMKKVFDEIDLQNYSIEETSDTCDNARLQGLTTAEKDLYCINWSNYFGLMRIINPDLNNGEIIQTMKESSRNTFKDIQALTYLIEKSFQIDKKHYYKFNKVLFDSDKCYINKVSDPVKEFNAGEKINYYSAVPRLKKAQQKYEKEYYGL